MLVYYLGETVYKQLPSWPLIIRQFQGRDDWPENKENVELDWLHAAADLAETQRINKEGCLLTK